MYDENKDILPDDNKETPSSLSPVENEENAENKIETKFENKIENEKPPLNFSGYGYAAFDMYSKNDELSKASNAAPVSNNKKVISDANNSFENAAPVNVGVSQTEQVKQQRKKRKKKAAFAKVFAALFAAMAFALVLGVGIGLAPKLLKSVLSSTEFTFSQTQEVSSSDDNTDEDVPIPTKNAQTLKELSDNTISIIKNVKPSVVCIKSTTETRDIFNYAYQSTGSGSGIIFNVTKDYIYVLTNCHVISGAETVGVSIEESDLINAELVGKSENDDLAVIALKRKDAEKAGVKNPKAAKFGNSDSLQTGSPVIAIGNALGEGNTATKGVVSALPKELTIENKKLTLLQTDAAINPGNSGGALVNGKGEVIGISTAKVATTTVEGIGYSIPINTAKPIVENFMNKKSTPFLGVYVATITAEMSEYYDLPKTGVIVSQIVEGSSAANSDIREGDIITSFNGEPIFTSDQLVEAVQKCDVGDNVDINIIRGDEKLTISVKLIANSDTSF
jgi:serine protease Do